MRGVQIGLTNLWTWSLSIWYTLVSATPYPRFHIPVEKYLKLSAEIYKDKHAKAFVEYEVIAAGLQQKWQNTHGCINFSLSVFLLDGHYEYLPLQNHKTRHGYGEQVSAEYRIRHLAINDLASAVSMEPSGPPAARSVQAAYD